MSKIIAVCPAYNEEKTIGAVLQETQKYVDKIIVVDDSSTDNTAGIAKKYATVVTNKTNQGYDKSIGNGFSGAQKFKPDIIITLDADGQHLPGDIPRVTEPIKLGAADIVVGIRPYRARFAEHVYAWFGRNYKIKDPLCGMKAYSNKVYKKIGFFDTINSIGTQLTFTAVIKGYRIAQVHQNLFARQSFQI